MSDDNARVTISDLMKRWKVSRETVWRMRRDDPDFPKPAPVRGSHRVRFNASEIDAYDAKLQAKG